MNNYKIIKKERLNKFQLNFKYYHAEQKSQHSGSPLTRNSRAGGQDHPRRGPGAERVPALEEGADRFQQGLLLDQLVQANRRRRQRNHKLAGPRAVLP